MALTHLSISNFRNLAAATLEPVSQGFNLLYGQNGSGKTSLLEAIYYLSLGRSFRNTLNNRIVRNSAEKMAIFANIAAKSGQNTTSVGVERALNSDLKIRIAGKDTNSVADLAHLTPVLLINPNCYNLLDGGPVFRRKYLDWGMFYQNPDFLRLWRQYERCLKQRNAALQARRPKNELSAWTADLVEKAKLLDDSRKEYIESLFPILMDAVAGLLPIPDLQVSYQPGWDDETPYQDVLEGSIVRDIQQGYTQFGPHRADVKISIKSTPAKDILSRGQQKLFVCAMILAQGALLQSRVNKTPIYLVDDLPSELDVVSRSSLITLLSSQKAQVFVTAIENNALNEFTTGAPLKVFHVEHGQITNVE